MMTKEEVKQEMRQTDHRPGAARAHSPAPDRARRGGGCWRRCRRPTSLSSTRRTTPSRCKYDGSRPAPAVGGQGPRPDRCRRSVRSPGDHDIPMVTNPPLARALYRDVEVGQMIPEALYAAVAEVLAYVYRTAGRMGLRRPSLGGGVAPHAPAETGNQPPITRLACAVVVPRSMRSHGACAGAALRSLIQRLLQHSDMAAAVVVVMVVVMMIVPLPSGCSTCASRSTSPARSRSWSRRCTSSGRSTSRRSPSLLLLTTLLRLALNVSVTRLVLLHGDAGKVIEAFGHFVVGGNFVVGLVVFLILIVIQFVVITNGAGRVAEVGGALHPRRHARQADGDRRRPERRPDHRRRGARAPRRDRTRGRLLRRHGRRHQVRQGRRHRRRASSSSINLVGGIAIGVLQHGLRLLAGGCTPTRC